MNKKKIFGTVGISVIMILIYTIFNVKTEYAHVVLSSNEDEIPNSSYIIGTNLFTKESNEIYDGNLTTSWIMLAAKTIASDELEDMIIYYKNPRGEWINSLTRDEIDVPQTFEIIMKNGQEYEVDDGSVPISTMEVGDYVEYPEVEGYSGSWQVLHLDTDGHIEILAQEVEEEVEFKGLSSTTGIGITYYGMNDAPKVLNEAAEKYMDETLSESARSFGSNPLDPYINMTTKSESDTYYLTDVDAYTEALTEEKIDGFKADVWVTSREISGYNTPYAVHQLRYYSVEKDVVISQTIVHSGTSYAVVSKNLAPVVKLKTDLKIIAGEGSKENPWQLTSKED